MQKVAHGPPPWEALAVRGAHFVLCNPKKIAMEKGWNENSPNLAAVIAHARGGGLVGVIPWSLGCVVIDVDDGAENAVEAIKNLLGAPLSWTKSQSEGGYHLWYRSDAGTGNSKWKCDAGGGDVRGGKGYAIIWDATKVAAGLEASFDGASPVDLRKLPKPKRGGATGAKAIAEAPPGDRNNTLYREARKAASSGSLDEPGVRAEAIARGLPPDEVDKTIASAKAGALSTPVFPLRDKAALQDGLSSMGVTVRYNLRRQRAEVKNGTGGWCDRTDRSAAHLRTELARLFRYQTAKDSAPLNFSEAAWGVCFDSILFSNEVDPFLEWLEALPAWDKLPRVQHWLDDCFEVDPEGDPDLLAWASQFVFLGPVWRTFQPGTKLDEMPVLSGPGGIGKSTALRLALPQNIEGLFGDGLHLAAREQDRAEALQGRVIVEASEMAGSTRAELESMKSFLVRIDDDTVRLAYRRNPEPSPRRCVIVGTTNVADPLPNDPTGNRRFVVLRLKGGDVSHLVGYLEGNRKQLWAEAVALYGQGVEAWLPTELAQVQSAVNETARRKDEMLEDALDRELPGAGVAFRLPWIAMKIGLIKNESEAATLDYRVSKRLTSALTRRGLASKTARKPGEPGEKPARYWSSAK